MCKTAIVSFIFFSELTFTIRLHYKHNYSCKEHNFSQPNIKLGDHVGTISVHTSIH